MTRFLELQTLIKTEHQRVKTESVWKCVRIPRYVKKMIKKTRVLLWKENFSLSEMKMKNENNNIGRLRCAFCSAHGKSSPDDTRVGRSTCMLGVSIAYTILNCGSARVFCCSTTAFVSTCDNTHAHTRISTRSWEKMLNFSRVLRSKFGWMEEKS